MLSCMGRLPTYLRYALVVSAGFIFAAAIDPVRTAIADLVSNSTPGRALAQMDWSWVANWEADLLAGIFVGGVLGYFIAEHSARKPREAWGQRAKEMAVLGYTSLDEWDNLDKSTLENNKEYDNWAKRLNRRLPRVNNLREEAARLGLPVPARSFTAGGHRLATFNQYLESVGDLMFVNRFKEAKAKAMELSRYIDTIKTD